MLFSLFAGSIAGAAIGITTLLLTRGRSGAKIPFGPYLAVGAVLWVFAGPELISLYNTWLLAESIFLSSFSLRV